MFFGYGFVVLILIVAYVFLRILTLLEGTRQKIVFGILFAAIVSSIPITEYISHSDALPRSGTLIRWGYMSLPFMLYLFLVVLVSDILKGINRLVKVVPAETLRSRPARMTTLALLLGIPVVIVIAGRVNYTNIRVNEYTVDTPRKTSRLEDLRIAVASDFHLREMTDPDFMPGFVQRMNSLGADVLLIPGDILEGDRQNEQLEEFERNFREIRTTYGVFGSLGNHESHGRGQKMAFFERAGIHVLQDTSYTVDNCFTLVGRNDYRLQRRKSMEDLMKETPGDLPVIAMDHKPTDLEAITRAGPGILVSGHTHNGQLWPFNYITDRIYDLSWGYRKIRDTHVFVTSGIQVWGPPVRTTGDSEIMLIRATLRSGSQESE